jgi:hypothetical protein
MSEWYLFCDVQSPDLPVHLHIYREPSSHFPSNSRPQSTFHSYCTYLVSRISLPKHTFFPLGTMYSLALIIALLEAATATMVLAELQKRQTYSGVATFNDYAEQSNTVCGPKSGKSSEPQPLSSVLST